MIFIEPYRFNESELKLFKEVYPNYTNKEIVEKFFPMLSKKSIMDRANRLKLNKTPEAFKRSREEANKNIGIAHKDKPKTEEHCIKISESKKGKFPEHLRYERTKSHKENIRENAINKGLWKGDKNPRHVKPLYGEDNGRWNGGSKQLYWDMREFVQQWKINSMEFWNYTCVITGENFREIHHLFPFREIVNETFQNLNLEIRPNINDYTLEERFLIEKEITSVNDKYGFGICLSKQAHLDFHNQYGYKDFNGDNFIEFLENRQANTEVIAKVKMFVIP